MLEQGGFLTHRSNRAHLFQDVREQLRRAAMLWFGPTQSRQYLVLIKWLYLASLIFQRQDTEKNQFSYSMGCPKNWPSSRRGLR